MANCAIVGGKRLEGLMLRYLGQAPALSRDETEVLLMALYMESCSSGGLGRRCTDAMDERLKAQDARVAEYWRVGP